MNDFQDVHERARSQGTVYFTVLDEKDYYNSSGERLTSVADILRQDRANYHKGQGGPRDEDDGGIFATKEGRSKFDTYTIVPREPPGVSHYSGTRRGYYSSPSARTENLCRGC